MLSISIYRLDALNREDIADKVIEYLKWGLGFIGVYIKLYKPLCPWLHRLYTPSHQGACHGLCPLGVIPTHSSHFIHSLGSLLWESPPHLGVFEVYVYWCKFLPVYMNPHRGQVREVFFGETLTTTTYTQDMDWKNLEEVSKVLEIHQGVRKAIGRHGERVRTSRGTTRIK